MQTSKQLVRNAIRRKPIDRLPVNFTLFEESDISMFLLRNPSNWKPKKEKIPFEMWSDYATGTDRATNIRKEDEWGCIWGVGKGTYGVGEVIGHPLREWSNFSDYSFPDPYAPGRFDGLDELILKNRDKYISFTHVFGIFERLHFLLGFNETLIDLVTDLERIEKLIDIIMEFQLAIIDRLGKNFGGRVHQYSITDDWGTQTNIFIDPDLWRKVFKPRYKILTEQLHKYDMDFTIHSDGNLTSIIEDFIEIGVDGLDLPQPSSIYGIKEFGERFGGRIGLSAYSDIQTTSVSGSKEKIIQEAYDMVKYWSNDECSGIVAKDYPDIESIGGDLERTKIALDAFKRAFEEKRSGSL